MAETNLRRGREDPLPLDALLLLLAGDFPELVVRARRILDQPGSDDANTEAVVRDLIVREATWENARHHRFTAAWVRRQIARRPR